MILGVGAALLPAGKTIPSAMIGGLLIAAGLIEMVAGSLRRSVRPFAMAAGGVTALAGLLFVINPETHFFPTVTPIIAWLLVRSLILAASATETGGSVRRWTALSAGMDFLLAILLIAGLSISTIVVSNLRISDLSGRIGGEEFAALLPCPLDEGVVAAERVREAFEGCGIVCDEEKVDTTVSIGVAGGPAGTELEVLLASADTALYQAKRGGRNRVEAAEEVPLSLEDWRRKSAGVKVPLASTDPAIA